ncbi:MAG: hypothetical protein AB8Y67_02145 [Coxiella-like endosymbiont]
MKEYKIGVDPDTVRGAEWKELQGLATSQKKRFPGIIIKSH